MQDESDSKYNVENGMIIFITVRQLSSSKPISNAPLSNIELWSISRPCLFAVEKSYNNNQ